MWAELQDTRDPDIREDLLVRMAECALRLHEFGDHEIPNYIQDAFTALRESELRYRLAALRVGRYVVQFLEFREEEDEGDAEGMAPPRPENTPN